MIFAASLFAITFSACSDDGDDNNDVAVTGITLSESSITLVAGGETTTLTATVTPDNATDKTVTWTSSNTSVATVEDGVVTPVAAGTATITAKAGDQTATCTVTVQAAGSTIAVAGITLNETSLTLHVEDTETLTATVTPTTATDKTVTWTSSDTGVATVENGKITAVAEGTATITAKAGEQTATCAVTVVAKDADIVAVTGITLNKTTLSLEEGDEETLTATVLPENATNKTVTWTSSDTGVATVENGKVTAVAAGNATITAKAGEQTAECAVTVTAAEEATVPVESITLNKTEVTLTEGSSEILKATVTPEGATDKTVTWSSSEETVATVNAEGKVIAVAVGTTTITATAGGQTAICTVTVKAAPEGARVWLSSNPVEGNCLNTKLSSVNTKFTTHSDVSIELTENDFISDVNLHVCKLDGGTGANLHIKYVEGTTQANNGDDIEDDYIEFTLKKQCTISFTSSNKPAVLKTSDGEEIETQSAFGDFSKALEIGTYRIYGTSSSGACRIKFLVFSES